MSAASWLSSRRRRARPAEQVERQREHLEGDEHREQVAGGGEQQHAADREHQQRVDLGVLDAAGGGLPLGLGAREGRGLAGERGDAGLDPALGEQRDAEQREDQDQAPEEHGRAVDDDRALGPDEAAAGAVGDLVEPVPGEDGERERGDHAAGGEGDLRDVALGAGQERLDDHPGAGDAEDDEQRGELEVLDGGLDEVVHVSPLPLRSAIPRQGRWARRRSTPTTSL